MKKKKVVESDLKLDLGCGDVVEAGFSGVDRRKCGQTYLFDLSGAWPMKDSVATEARAIHLLQYLPGHKRTMFANELYRVLKPGAKCSIVIPHWNSSRAYQDPLIEWPPISETTFIYWNAEWRKQNKAEHYGLNCDFDFTYGYSVVQPWGSKAEEPRGFAIAHHSNVVQDLHVNLVSRKK